MKRQNTRTLALIVSTFTYMLIGAAIFDYLESDNERKQDHMLITATDFYRQKYNISSEDWRIIETIVVRQVPHKAGRQWSFAGAIYFSLTVLTTIGYGHSAPLTQMGKIFCMLYAVTGIPLSLVMYQSVGERINTFVAFMLRHVKRCARVSPEVTDTDLIVVIGSLSTLVIMFGAWGFAHNENWSYFDAIYYCFITLSTIGFGDYVALQKDRAFDTRWQYVAFSIIFILIGLNMFAALMNLLVLRFLTANTEDERKQAIEAEVARQSAVQVQGDVITRNKANGQISTYQRGSGGAPGANLGMPATETRGGAISTADPDADRRSVCSCSCYSYRPNAPMGGIMTQADDDSPPGTPLLIPSQAHHQNVAQSRQHSSDFTATTAVEPHQHQKTERLPYVYSSHDMQPNSAGLSNKLRPYTVTRSPGKISHLLNTHQNLVAHHTLAGPYFYGMPTSSTFRPSSATFSTTPADDALSFRQLRPQSSEQQHELVVHR